MAKHLQEKPFLDLPSVTGTLRWRGHAVDVSWSVGVSQSGKISLAFGPVELTRQTAWILETIGGRGRFATWAQIRGSTPDRQVVESSHVVFTGHRRTGGTVHLEADASRLRLTQEATIELAKDHVVGYHTIGMLGFRQQTAVTDAGHLRLAAPSKLDDYGLISGMIAIEAPEGDLPFMGWLAACDELAEQVLGVISLAEGRLIRWSIRQIQKGDRIVGGDFHGPQNNSPPWDQTWHFLDLQPVLGLALEAYTKELRNRTGFQIALEWFLTRSAYLELQLLSAFGALEHLVAAFCRQTAVLPIVPEKLFEPLLERVKKLLDAEASANPLYSEELRRLGRSAERWNNSSFHDRLLQMLRGYGVVLDGLEEHLGAAITARNAVVHRGMWSDPSAERSLYRHVAVLRELLKRVFLTLLGYKGQYHSMLNGSEWLPFPPVGVALDLED